MTKQKRSIKDMIIHDWASCSIKDMIIYDWASSWKRSLSNFAFYTTIGILIAHFIFGAPQQWGILIGACSTVSLMIVYAYYLKFSSLAIQEE